MNKYEIRTDPSNVHFINKVHNFYRFCDMSDVEAFLVMINQMKSVLWDVKNKSDMITKLSQLFPYKDKNDEYCMYYRVIAKITYETESYERSIPDGFTPEMRLYQCLYIELNSIIDDIMRIADLYYPDNNTPKKKLSMNDINIALSKDNNYKHFYPQEIISKPKSYQILIKEGIIVDENTTKKQAKKKYRDWLLKNHPDKGGNVELCAKVMNEYLMFLS